MGEIKSPATRKILYYSKGFATQAVELSYMDAPRVALCGFYDKGNFGDDLMEDCLSDVLGKTSHVTVYSDHTSRNILDGRKPGALDNSDIIVVGGGNIIGPNFWLFQSGAMLRAIEMKKRIVCLNIGVTDDYLSDLRFASFLKQMNGSWWVRDRESNQRLTGIGIESNYLPDISFTLNSEGKTDHNQKKLSVFLNSYVLKGLFDTDDVLQWLSLNRLARLIAHHLDWMSDFGWKIQLIASHVSTEIDDRIPSAVIHAMMKCKDDACWNSNVQNWREIKYAIESSNMVLSMRYHASTCAIASGVPLVDLTHHAKNLQLLNEHGASAGAVDISTIDHKMMINATAASENKPVGGSLVRANATKSWSEFEAWWTALCCREIE